MSPREGANGGEVRTSTGRNLLFVFLNALLIATFSAAVVVTLGAEGTFYLGATRVSVYSVWWLFVPAGILWTIRRYLSGPSAFQKPLADQPSAALPVGAPLWNSSSVLWCCGAVAICLWPLREQLSRLRAVIDLGDPVFSAWRLAWFAHQITDDPANLFSANIFFPQSLTLTYSDAMLLPGLAAAPLIWAGVDPIAVVNLFFLAFIVAAAVAFFVVTYTTTLNGFAAFIAGILGGLHPYHFEHYSHLELQTFFFAPLAILYLNRILRWRYAPRDIAILVVVVAAQMFSSLYYGVMLLTYLVPLGLCLLVFYGLPTRRQMLRASCGIATVALIGALIAQPYLSSRSQRGDRSPGEVQMYSARGRDWGFANGRHWLYGQTLTGDWKPERQLFPGITLTIAPFLGLLPAASPLGTAYLVSGAMAFDWSLGLNGLTFDELRSVIAFKGLRVPARFAAFVATSCVLLTGLAIARGSSRLRSSRSRVVAAVMITSFVVLDVYPSVRLVDAWSEHPPIYSAVDQQMVLAEFPMGEWENTAYMYFSTKHWARLVNGYSGFVPPSYHELLRSTAGFPDAKSLAALRERGVSHISVNCYFYRSSAVCRSVLEMLDSNPEVTLLVAGQWQGQQSRLYSFTGAGT